MTASSTVSTVQAPTQRRMTSATGILAIPATMAGLTLAIALFANSFWLSASTSAFALALSIAGLAILYGQLGLVSLCQFALVGVGGWITLRIGHAFHPPFELSMLAAGIGTSIVGLLFGLPALRLRGLYLALVTLMLAGAFQTLIGAWGFPDGGEGFLGRASGAGRVMLPRPDLATTAVPYFIYVTIVVTLGLMLAQWHKQARPGRAWALIRKGETVAVASGVNVLIFKAWAFGLSGFLAGISGALLAGNVGQLDGRAFSAFESLNLFALAIVGGVYNWFGAIVAGLLLRALPALLNDLGIDGYVTIGIFGIALLHALATAPAGVAGQLAVLVSRLRRLASRGQSS